MSSENIERRGKTKKEMERRVLELPDIGRGS
jgi:hypothetical protein